jgi:hypothetical protein
MHVKCCIPGTANIFYSSSLYVLWRSPHPQLEWSRWIFRTTDDIMSRTYRLRRLDCGNDLVQNR